MRVRIRLNAGPQVHYKHRKNQHVALALAALLTPAAVMACVLSFWRLTADFHVTSQFPISDGLFSHWQVWLASAGILQLGSIMLNRYGNAKPVIHEPVEEPERKLANSRF